MAEYGIMYRDEMVRALRRPVGDPLRKSVTRRKIEFEEVSRG